MRGSLTLQPSIQPEVWSGRRRLESCPEDVAHFWRCSARRYHEAYPGALCVVLLSGVPSPQPAPQVIGVNELSIKGLAIFFLYFAAAGLDTAWRKWRPEP